MGLFDSLFGRPAKKPPRKPRAGAGRKSKDDGALSLQLLFDEPPPMDTRRLTAGLRGYHPSLSRGAFEVDVDLQAKGTPVARAEWADHVVELVGFNLPMPAEVVERCVQPSHYGAELKARARSHKAHALLYYAGAESSPLEQYVALATVAAVLVPLGVSVILNETACTSFPAGPLAAGEVEGDAIENIRSLPLLVLFCGFVKMDGDPRGIWMRTHGNHLLGLPDLAHLATSHESGQEIFDIFCNVLSYLLSSGAKLGVGHTMQVGDDKFMKLRAPTGKETFLDSEGELLVAEFISEREVNRRN